MSKTVQIPWELFRDLYNVIILDVENPEAVQRIKVGLQAKMDAMERRTLYTKSKTSGDPEEKEKSRQAYLDKVGMLPDWRY